MKWVYCDQKSPANITAAIMPVAMLVLPAALMVTLPMEPAAAQVPHTTALYIATVKRFCLSRMAAMFVPESLRVNVTVDPARRESTADVDVQPVPVHPTAVLYRPSVAVFKAPVYVAAGMAGKVID